MRTENSKRTMEKVSVPSPVAVKYGVFKKTTTAMATGKSLNKRFLMSGTMAVHLRYNSGYISLPSSANQQREMTKFCVVWRT